MCADSPWHCARRATLASRLVLIALLAAGCGDKTPAAPAAATAGEFPCRARRRWGLRDRDAARNADRDRPSGECGRTGRAGCAPPGHISSVQAPLEYATFDPLAEVLYPALCRARRCPMRRPIPSRCDALHARFDRSQQRLGGVKRDGPRSATEHDPGGMNEIPAQQHRGRRRALRVRIARGRPVEQLAASIGVSTSKLSPAALRRLAFPPSFFKPDASVTIVGRPPAPDVLHHEATTYRHRRRGVRGLVTPQDLDPYVGPGNPAPTFLGHVRSHFYLLIETHRRASTRSLGRGDVSHRHRGGGLDAGTAMSATSTRSAQVFALGGNPELALDTVNGDFERVRPSSPQWRCLHGTPTSYVVRAVRDNRWCSSRSRPSTTCASASGRRVVAGTRSCVQRFPWRSIPCPRPAPGASCAGRTTGGIPTWRRFRRGERHRPATTSRPRQRARALHQLPAARVAAVPGLRFRTPLHDLRSRAQILRAGREIPSDFVCGRFREPARVYGSGSRTITSCTCARRWSDAEARHRIRASEFFLYTFRFSRTEGMATMSTACCAHRPDAHDAARRLHRRFAGAGASSSLNVSVAIAEMKAVGVALSDADRSRVENEIMLLYGL